jgi:hypothetical protein
MSSGIRKAILFLLMLFTASRVFAPVDRSLVITKGTSLRPFGKLINAVGMVETRHDTLAYNPEENAVGYFQIRPIRLIDYNRRTGSNFKMEDLYDYFISERIFLFYASEIGPYNFEKIAKKWNGSGRLTALYWDNVKSNL